MYNIFKDNILQETYSSFIEKDGCVTINNNFTEEEYFKLWNGCEYINGEIIETEQYTNLAKQEEINALKVIAKKGEENMSKYKTVEAVPAELDPNRDYKLNFLQNRANEITAEYLAAESVLVEKYGVSVLDELI